MPKQTYPIVATRAEKAAGLRGINRDQRLYLIPSGSGFSCLGFDVAHERTAAVAAWLKNPGLAPPSRRGTLKAWRAYKAAMAAGFAHHQATRERATFGLTPRLVGLEGRRVEVSYPDGQGGIYRRRFNVGRSSGWAPCHLEIANRRSSGGGAAYVPDNATVSVVG